MADAHPLKKSWHMSLGSNCWLSVFVLGKMSCINGWRSGDCDIVVGVDGLMLLLVD